MGGGQEEERGNTMFVRDRLIDVPVLAACETGGCSSESASLSCCVHKMDDLSLGEGAWCHLSCGSQYLIPGLYLTVHMTLV